MEDYKRTFVIGKNASLQKEGGKAVFQKLTKYWLLLGQISFYICKPKIVWLKTDPCPTPFFLVCKFDEQQCPLRPIF
jgi:hypothetical protein